MSEQKGKEDAQWESIDHQGGLFYFFDPKLKSFTVFILIAFVLFLVVSSILRYRNFSTTAFSSFASTVAAFLTLFVILKAADVAVQQIKAAKQARDLDAVSRLLERFRSKEMYQALDALWNKSPRWFRDNDDRQNQRRIVFHFLRLIAIAVEKELTEREDLLARLFVEDIAVWVRIKPLNQELNEGIIRRRHEENGIKITEKVEKGIKKEAEDWVNESEVEWLFNRWKDKYKIEFERLGIMSNEEKLESESSEPLFIRGGAWVIVITLILAVGWVYTQC